MLDSTCSLSLSHARHDPVTCLTPGLFRSLRRGDRKKQKLDVTYRYGENESARFIGFEPLGVDDMRLLQWLVASAGPNGVLLAADHSGNMGRQLRLRLDARFDAQEQDCLVVKSSISKLLDDAGLARGGNNFTTLKASLIRLSNVTMVVRNGSRQASFHLMSHAFDEDDGRLFVAINPRISEAVLGYRPHTRIELVEVKALKSEPACLIHQRLCGWLNPGRSAKLDINTLAGYVWIEPAANINTMKTRKQAVKKALSELVEAGWAIKEGPRGTWQITRPRCRAEASA